MNLLYKLAGGVERRQTPRLAQIIYFENFRRNSTEDITFPARLSHFNCFQGRMSDTEHTLSEFNQNNAVMFSLTVRQIASDSYPGFRSFLKRLFAQYQIDLQNEKDQSLALLIEEFSDNIFRSLVRLLFPEETAGFCRNQILDFIVGNFGRILAEQKATLPLLSQANLIFCNGAKHLNLILTGPHISDEDREKIKRKLDFINQYLGHSLTHEELFEIENKYEGGGYGLLAIAKIMKNDFPGGKIRLIDPTPESSAIVISFPIPTYHNQPTEFQFSENFRTAQG